MPKSYKKPQQIVWTVLPTGMVNQHPVCSVLVSPRLGKMVPFVTKMHIPLNTFEVFREWPERVKDMQFALELRSGERFKATRLEEMTVGETTGITLRNNLWKALFPDATPVDPYWFPDYSTKVFRSYPVREVLNNVKGIYSEIANRSPDSYPPLKTWKGHQREASLQAVISDLGHRAKEKERMMELDHELGDPHSESYRAFSSGRDREFPFIQANRFFNRTESKDEFDPDHPLPDASRVPPRPENTTDFHRMVAALADHPVLLRMLGLVIDLEIDVLYDKFPKTDFEARLLFSWGKIPNGGPRPDTLTPWTACTSNTFLPVPKSQGRFLNRHLNLQGVDDNPQSNTLFGLYQIDTDGAALKLSNFAENMNRLLPSGWDLDEFKDESPADLIRKNHEISLNVPGTASLPSLQSPGITLFESGRARRLVQYTGEMPKKNSQLEQNDLTLYAEDLVRGFRIDILEDKKDQWQSLCRRKGEYLFPDGVAHEPIRDVHDEGYVKGASVTSQPSKDRRELYLHEAMFKWTGWSLCAERPGRTTVPKTHREVAHDDPDREVSVQEEVPADEVSSQDFVFDGLPVHPSFKAEDRSLPRLRYGRSYRVRARCVDLAGNSEPWDTKDAESSSDPVTFYRFEPVPHPVLVPVASRVTEGESVERMVIRSNYTMKTEEYRRYLQIKGIADESSYPATCRRQVVPPKTSQIMAEMHGMFDQNLDPAGVDDPDERASLFRDAFKSIAEREAAQIGEVRDEQYALPYLPDPLALGASFRNLPGAQNITNISEEGVVTKFSNSLNLVTTPYSGTWPSLDPFRLSLAEGSGAPEWDAEERILTVYLEKGKTATVRYSSFIDQFGRQKMGIWHWTHMSDDPYTLTGTHWMLTPFRELTLVHAVQQPLKNPEITDISLGRNPGGTIVKFISQKKIVPGSKTKTVSTTRFSIDAKSTSKVDLFADWDDFIDDPVGDPAGNKDPREPLKKSTHVFEVKVHQEDLDELEIKWDNYANQLYCQEFGDTRHYNVNYHLEATTRFREYFPASVTNDPKNIIRPAKKEAPLVRTVSVPSTTRPAAPRVLYVIPVFGRSEGLGLRHGSKKMTRQGGGLRVYLDRPWYSSGEGEMLAVVLYKGDKKIDDQPFKPYVTQWGRDPIWISGPTRPASQTPVLKNFTLASIRRSNLQLEELDDPKVDVAAHKVDWDPERKLWYCDIRIDPGPAYYPFIRLALARYQHESLAGVELSRVVLADFAQLAPDRTVLLTDDPSGDPGTKISVTVTGPRPNWFDEVLDNITMEVVLEEPDPSFDEGDRDEDLGWRTCGDPTCLKHTGITIQPAWKGSVTLPHPRTSRPYRIVVKEYEFIPVDYTPRTHKYKLSRKMERRLVYSERIYL